jgi:hypothetical protein
MRSCRLHDGDDLVDVSAQTRGSTVRLEAARGAQVPQVHERLVGLTAGARTTRDRRRRASTTGRPVRARRACPAARRRTRRRDLEDERTRPSGVSCLRRAWPAAQWWIRARWTTRSLTRQRPHQGTRGGRVDAGDRRQELRLEVAQDGEVVDGLPRRGSGRIHMSRRHGTMVVPTARTRQGDDGHRSSRRRQQSPSSAPATPISGASPLVPDPRCRRLVAHPPCGYAAGAAAQLLHHRAHRPRQVDARGPHAAAHGCRRRTGDARAVPGPDGHRA